MSSIKSKKIIYTLLILLSFQLFIFKSLNSVNAQSEVAEDFDSDIRPLPNPNLQNPSLAPVDSRRPIGRPPIIRELTPEEIRSLQAKPCPGSAYCPGLPAGANGFNARCGEFINSDGAFPGDGTGIVMLEAMQEVEAAHKTDVLGSNTAQCSFFENIDFGTSCPNFRYMTPLQKQHVWVWLWAAMAQAESSCNPTATAEGIENEALGRFEIADGLYGLEYHMETRETNARDPRFCPHESVSDTQNLFYQSRCAASIMFDTNCRRGSIVNSGSYWQEMASWPSKVPQLMQQHPLCKVN